MGLFEFVLKLSCIFSMVSVCLHTPDTIHVFPSLEYVLFVIDLMVTVFFTLEALLKVGKTKRCSELFLIIVSQYFSYGNFLVGRKPMVYLRGYEEQLSMKEFFGAKLFENSSFWLPTFWVFLS